MISDDKRFIFVHVEKTGGTSIGQALLPYVNPRPTSRVKSAVAAVVVPRDHRRHRFGTHAPIRDAERHMTRDTFRDYYKFAFVRNPWDRLVSEYNAAIRKSRRVRHRRIRAFATFEDYIHYEIRRGKFFQYPKICGLDGTPALDFIGRFERLEADFALVCGELALAATLGRFNVFPHAGYREFYNARTRDLVERNWRDDVEYFGYAF